MGGQQSTRKLTLDNDDPSNVIKVSDAVVNRLRGNAEARNRGASTSAAAPRGPAPAPAPTVPSPVPARGISSGIAVSPLYPQYMYEATPTSLQVRQEKEAALQKNDQYWQHRINKIEETHENINKLMKKEYEDAVQEVKDGFNRTTSVGRKPACVEGKKAVMACYKKHPDEPMKCAQEVQAFAECVDKHRTALVSNRG